MFEQLATKQVKPKDVKLKSPVLLSMLLEGESEPATYELSKIAQSKIHKCMDIKVPTSTELYKKELTIWETLRDKRLENAKILEGDGEHFDLLSNNVRYIICPEQYLIVDIDYELDISNFDKVDNSIENFMLDMSTNRNVNKFFGDSSNGPIKLICYPKDCDVNNDTYVPAVIFELQLSKSKFICYTGVLMMSPYIILPNIGGYISTDSFYTFLYYYNMSDMLEIAANSASTIYESYNLFKQNPVEVSAREVTSILKKVGYKLQLKSDDDIGEIENMYDESSNQEIQNFYNTFKFVTGESALDILQLSELQKIFRYNKLTLLDLLSILSKEYITPTGGKITCDILSNFMYNLQSANSLDKEQVAGLKNKLSQE